MLCHFVLCYGGFYIVRVMPFHSEFSLLPNGMVLGVTFGTGRGEQTVTPKFVPFTVSVLAVVTNKVEPPYAVLQYNIIYDVM